MHYQIGINMKQELKGGAEADWVDKRWRGVLCYLINSTGVGKKIKRGMNKRIRREGKDECKEG